MKRSSCRCFGALSGVQTSRRPRHEAPRGPAPAINTLLQRRCTVSHTSTLFCAARVTSQVLTISDASQRSAGVTRVIRARFESPPARGDGVVLMPSRDVSLSCRSFYFQCRLNYAAESFLEALLDAGTQRSASAAVMDCPRRRLCRPG